MNHSTFYENFGRLANTFAYMEGNVRRLIAGVAFKDDFVTASVFLDSSQLRNNLKMIRKLAKQYLIYEEDFRNIASSVDKIVDKRNLFIHGIWTPNTFGEDDGFALVQDLKTKHFDNARARTWASGQAEKVSLSDFHEIFKAIRGVVDLIEELIKKLEKDEDYEFNGHTSFMSIMQYNTS